MTEAAMPDCIKEQLDCLDRQREKILAMIPTVLVAHGIVDRLRHGNLDGRPTVNVGVGAFSLNGVLIHLDDLRSQRQVAPLLRALADAGFHLSGKPEDYAEIRRRTWTTKSSEGAEIKILGFFNGDDGEACRFVAVGEKVEKVYKLVCPDSVEPEPEPEIATSRPSDSRRRRTVGVKTRRD
jgi:hypothetical protein